MDADPLITLRTALIAGWDGAADLDGAIDTLGGDESEVLCSTGWYDDDFLGPQLSISESSEYSVPLALGCPEVWVYATYDFNVWVPVIRASSKGAGLAKKYRWQMQQEVKRILKANRTGLTNIKEVVLNGSGVALDELNREPPILRFLIQATVIRDI